MQRNHVRTARQKKAWLDVRLRRGYLMWLSGESAYRRPIIRSDAIIADTLLGLPNSINVPELLGQG